MMPNPRSVLILAWQLLVCNEPTNCYRMSSLDPPAPSLHSAWCGHSPTLQLYLHAHINQTSRLVLTCIQATGYLHTYSSLYHGAGDRLSLHSFTPSSKSSRSSCHFRLCCSWSYLLWCLLCNDWQIVVWFNVALFRSWCLVIWRQHRCCVVSFYWVVYFLYSCLFIYQSVLDDVYWKLRVLVCFLDWHVMIHPTALA